MALKFSKYLLMAFPACITLWEFLPLWDSCEMSPGLLTSFLSALLFILIVSIYTGISLWRSQKRGKGFDGIPLLLLLAFSLVTLMHFGSKSSKFWTSEIATLKKNHHFLSWELVFYGNESFKLERITEHSRCAYYGDYTVANDTIFLDRPDIAYLSENNFCQKYQVQDSILVPMLDSFPVLSFHKGSLSQLIAE